jgi:hypothetical protein
MPTEEQYRAAGRLTNPNAGGDCPAATCSLWIHRGAGHYIGSLVIVCAENKGDAEAIIREQLDKCGLKDEPLEVTEAAFSKNSVIVCNDGDY